MAAPISRRDAAIHAAIDPPILYEGTEVVRGEGWYQLVNPRMKDASANEVMLSCVADSELERRVESAFAVYRGRELPFRWAIGPMSSERIEAVISPRASARWDFLGMAIDAGAELAIPENIELEPTSAENLGEFLEINLSGWELRGVSAEARAKLEAMAVHPGYRCFIARQNGRAIGSAATILRGSYGYLIGGVVLEEFRGCGAYRALVGARLRDLKRLGRGFAVTQARTATSAPVLSRIGFETLFGARIYRFDSR